MTVYDLEGRCLAHGAKKERIGKSLPATKRIEDKVAYFEVVDGSSS
jgi:hypothetical protein